MLRPLHQRLYPNHHSILKILSIQDLRLYRLDTMVHNYKIYYFQQGCVIRRSLTASTVRGCYRSYRMTLLANNNKKKYSIQIHFLCIAGAFIAHFSCIYGLLTNKWMNHPGNYKNSQFHHPFIIDDVTPITIIQFD